ncbi:MAG: hypothetical protein SWH68_10910 [Thermodesulfobacteriota bacterium]|nr:hypothetical protein [Thermodesulfobacteriota bacterium]
MWTEKNINAYLAVFFVFLVAGGLVHQNPSFAGSALGHTFGIVGSLFILMTLIYPFRKRVLKKKGRQNPLNSHIAYGLIGASLVVIHSAHKFSSLIGILVFLSLVLVVLSGVVGRYLYKHVNRSLREQRRDRKLLKARIDNRKRGITAACLPDGTIAMEEAGLPEDPPNQWPDYDIHEDCNAWLNEIEALAEKEYAMRVFDRLKNVFSRWIRIHFLISFFLFAMIMVHVLTTLYYGLSWLG